MGGVYGCTGTCVTLNLQNTHTRTYAHTHDNALVPVFSPSTLLQPSPFAPHCTELVCHALVLP